MLTAIMVVIVMLGLFMALVCILSWLNYSCLTCNQNEACCSYKHEPVVESDNN